MSLSERAAALKQSIPVELIIVSLGGETFYQPGSGWTKTRCPFHGDDHPSASISPDGMYFMCLACGHRGDVFDLVQQAGFASNFPEAIEWLEEHVPIPGESTTGNW